MGYGIYIYIYDVISYKSKLVNISPILVGSVKFNSEALGFNLIQAAKDEDMGLSENLARSMSQSPVLWPLT